MVSSLTLPEMERGIGGAFDRELGRNEMGMSRNNFGDSFERGMGSYFCHAPLSVVTILVDNAWSSFYQCLNIWLVLCLLQETPSTWIA